MTAKEIADGAYAGDETCREVYRISGEKLGKMLSILIDLLNPEAVVIGGVFARSAICCCRMQRRLSNAKL